VTTRYFAILPLLALAACEPGVSGGAHDASVPLGDAEPPADAGEAPDASWEPLDASTGLEPDAGAPEDAGVDAGRDGGTTCPHGLRGVWYLDGAAMDRCPALYYTGWDRQGTWTCDPSLARNRSTTWALLTPSGTYRWGPTDLTCYGFSLDSDPRSYAIYNHQGGYACPVRFTMEGTP
jgi:hypothetical protein